MTAALPQTTPTPPQPDGCARWATAPGVLLKRWPGSDDGVVYDGRHARTHLLAGAGCNVLACCREGTATLAALAEQTNSDLELTWATVTALEVAGLLFRDAQPVVAAP